VGADIRGWKSYEDAGRAGTDDEAATTSAADKQRSCWKHNGRTKEGKRHLRVLRREPTICCSVGQSLRPPSRRARQGPSAGPSHDTSSYPLRLRHSSEYRSIAVSQYRQLLVARIPRIDQAFSQEARLTHMTRFKPFNAGLRRLRYHGTMATARGQSLVPASRPVWPRCDPYSVMQRRACMAALVIAIPCLGVSLSADPCCEINISNTPMYSAQRSNVAGTGKYT
jgi:hypothetical protein